MAAITERDATALLEIVSDGASDSGMEPIPSTVLSGLARLIPSDVFVGYEEADLRDGVRVIEEIDVVGEDGPAKAEFLRDVFHDYGWQDPLHGRLHARDERVLRLSDHVTARERRNLEFDALVWRPLGIRDALRMWLPPEGAHVRTIYLERSGKDYTTRDVTLLSLLRPHLIRLRKNAEFRRGAGERRGLTTREAEILGWVGCGKRNAEIAQILFISPNTVRKHLENIFEKLDVSTRTAAVAAMKPASPE